MSKTNTPASTGPVLKSLDTSGETQKSDALTPEELAAQALLAEQEEKAKAEAEALKVDHAAEGTAAHLAAEQALQAAGKDAFLKDEQEALSAIRDNEIEFNSVAMVAQTLCAEGFRNLAATHGSPASISDDDMTEVARAAIRQSRALVRELDASYKDMQRAHNRAKASLAITRIELGMMDASAIKANLG